MQMDTTHICNTYTQSKQNEESVLFVPAEKNAQGRGGEEAHGGI